MPIDPNNDQNEAYEIVPMKPGPHGPRGDWWTVTCNGIPVRHFSPSAKESAERYCRDRVYRLSLIQELLHNRKPV